MAKIQRSIPASVQHSSTLPRIMVIKKNPGPGNELESIVAGSTQALFRIIDEYQ
jgi:hypothetical protein